MPEVQKSAAMTEDFGDVQRADLGCFRSRQLNIGFLISPYNLHESN
jgi:hypothetical protein